MSRDRDLPGRLAAIEETIALAAARARRSRQSITLVAVSKTQPVESLLAAYAAGVRHFGENRVQEALGKQPALPNDVVWHLVGPLQSNKAGVAARSFAVCHAIDRPKIASSLAAAATTLGRRLPVFIEVNLGGESSKHGFAPELLVETLAPLGELAGLDWRGLMAIPPPGPNPQASRPWFVRLRQLRDEIAAARVLPGFAGDLSMGMSDDYAVAIEEGATHVRIGTALFGPRSASSPAG